MIIDITGVVLIPGNMGKDCPGNGRDPETECCCDECDYMQCCIDVQYTDQCSGCTDRNCPRNNA